MSKARRHREGSLTEDEVGIIRNLLARGGYKNQDILGLVNTVRRLEGRADTNGGRISDVKTEKARYKGIKAATDEYTEAFIARAKNTASYDRINTNPLSSDILARLFSKNKDKETLNITETDQIECKESYNKHWAKDYIRPIMAFANNKGGYLVFGVKDKTWEIKGIDSKTFKQMDRKDATQAFLHNLSCAIDFDTALLKFGSKSIGIVYISPTIVTLMPIMAINQNNSSNTSPGQIYYRYQAENNLIRPAELQKIIEERIRGLSETILTKHIQNILSNGIENSAVLNLETGEVDGKGGNFLIDEAILPKIKFVKEGEFVEKSGAPTLKLLGEIKSASKVIGTKREDLIKAYPYSWEEMTVEVKKQLPNSSIVGINNVIKDEKMKQNVKYSAYNFRNKKQTDEYGKTGKLPSVPTSIYNLEAVNFIVKKLKEAME